jgi:hypothetical protein
VQVTAPQGFTKVEKLIGAKEPLATGATITVDEMPVLLSST